MLKDLFLPPTDERLSGLILALPQIRVETEPLRDFVFYPQWSRLLDELGTLDDVGVAAMRIDHSGVFERADPEHPCPPYETGYSPRGGHDAGMVVADLQEAYARFGLVPAEHRAPDHLSTELEFVGALCSREGEDGLAIVTAERAFLRSHLLRWLPRFATGIEAVRPGGPYSRAAETAAAFVGHDERLLAGLLALGGSEHG